MCKLLYFNTIKEICLILNTSIIFSAETIGKYESSYSFATILKKRILNIGYVKNN